MIIAIVLLAFMAGYVLVERRRRARQSAELFKVIASGGQVYGPYL